MIGWGLAAVVGGALVVAFVKLGRYHTPSFHAAWKAWAAGRGAKVGEKDDSIQLELDVGHARATIGVARGRKTALLHTFVRTPWVLMAGPPFELADEGLETAAALPGWGDFSTGDAALDARFLRRALDPAPVLDTVARERLAALPLCALRGSEQSVTLTLRGIVEEPDALDAAVALVAHVAALDVDAVIAVLRDLPGAEVVMPEQMEKGFRRPLGASLHAHGVTLAYTAHEGRRVTRAVATLPPEHPSGWFHVDAEGRPDAVLEGSTLPPTVLPLLPAVGESVLRFGAGRIQLSMDGAVLDPARLLAAADVCREVRASSAAALYR